ncbi:MAG TPA: phosphoribulokinase [Candidatus Binatia bacterium]|nr:phosphoribulokinase [Candidatus Binatia bacterium]
MSLRHPILSVTGSSGAGTTTVMQAFEGIFRREKIKVQIVEGDAFHRYDRLEMRARMKQAEAAHRSFSHFAPDANLLDELDALFRSYSASGSGRVRRYVHDEEEALAEQQPSGTFTAWHDVEPGTDMLFYEGLHGGYADSRIDLAAYADLLIGVVPVINLEWIQKLRRDQNLRGYSHEAVVDTILRRMPDYVNHICSQFSRTHVNFQRVPTVDTSNPFIARDIPSADESMVVIRFANPKGIDFPYLLSMLHNSMMTRPNTIVVPGGKMGLAMQLIFTPMILRLLDLKKRA